MQMNLSNLVDLALGSPENVNSDMLHILLHVIIKKLDIANSCIELSEESAEKAKILLQHLPQEPAICFREYKLKADGGKIRKKSYRAVCAQKSLIHINKKWPKISTQNGDNHLRSSGHFEIHTYSSMYDRISKIEERLTAMENQYERKPHKKIVESDSDELNTEWPINSELKWLKKKLLELSDSLKLHSNCLKRVKCEEIPRILNAQNNFADKFHKQCSTMVTAEEINTQTSTFIETLKQIGVLQEQMLRFVEKIKILESNFGSHLKRLDSELDSIKNLLDNKNIRKILTQSNEIQFELVNTKNLQKSGIPSEAQEQLKDSESSEEKYHKLKNWSSSKIIDIQKQVSSYSICMHKFVRDLSSKIDRSEFETYRDELKDAIDVVMQIKRDITNLPTAAGCTIPLMKTMNCISCQTSANMTITTVPKHGRGDFCDDYQSSKTTVKITKRPINSRMKFKRFNTPYKCSTPLLVYKNRYRRNCYY